MALTANCSAGSYYNAGGNKCSACPLGAYQPVHGQKKCISCGENLTTAMNGTVKELDCIGNVCYIMYA